MIIANHFVRFTTAWCAHAGCLLASQSANSTLSPFRNEWIFDIASQFSALWGEKYFFQFVLILFLSKSVKAKRRRRRVFCEAREFHEFMFVHMRATDENRSVTNCICYDVWVSVKLDVRRRSFEMTWVRCGEVCVEVWNCRLVLYRCSFLINFAPLTEASSWKVSR